MAIQKEITIQSARGKIARFIEDGDISFAVLDALYDGTGFVPSEGYLFDYKRQWPSQRSELLKYIRHVAAFYNTFGGYIIFGVDEVRSDSLFESCVNVSPSVDLKQFKDLIREHLTSPVEIVLKTHCINISDSVSHYVSVLHIPKRARTDEPVGMKKNILNDKSKFIAQVGDTYLRDGDNSIPAQTQSHWRTLYGPRVNPYLIDVGVEQTPKILENNLPDRGLIYGKFFGRTGELEKLWKWFGDDFSRVRVLAGEGGLGKTSIAYEFASDVCRSAPLGLECVVWLTAKKKQFRAFINSFEELGLEVYESTSDLLRQIGVAMGLTPAEVDDCPDALLPPLVKRAAADISALVVIDDLDSLGLDEQKRAIEVCQQFSGTKSRFLFTTRKNITASTASSIEIDGFDLEEFTEFLEAWVDRLRLPSIPAADIPSLHVDTGGSPLFTESILRLLKSGMPIHEAVKAWKGELGIEVRNAALKREVLQLKMEARKVLVVVATLGSCSFTEIKRLSGFTDQTVLDAADELQTLFLVSTPPIAKEPRFAISSTTRLLVASLGGELLPGYSEFVKEIHQKKYKSSGGTPKVSSRSVAAAINQAMAQMADGRPDDAVKTVDEVNKQLGGKNADLLSVKARALAATNAMSQSVVRKAFEAAYDAGQKKEVFFDYWYRAEIAAKNYDGAIQVVDRALRTGVEEADFWVIKRIESRLEAARNHKKSDQEHAVTQIKHAMAELARLIKSGRAKENVGALKLRKTLEVCADLHWDLPRASGDVRLWLEAVERQLEAIQLGDVRYETYIRSAVAFVGLRNAAPIDNDSLRKLSSQKLRNVISTFKIAPRGVSRTPQFQAAFKELQDMAKG